MQPSDPDDDWFGPEEEALSPTDADVPVSRTEDDWLDEAPVVPRRRRPSPLVRVDRRVLVVAGSVIALLIAGLAAGGVFSSGGSPSSNPPPTTAPTTARQATTTAATRAQSVAVPTGPLKPGDSGAQVTLLQRDLARLGFSAGKADGQYGPSTTDAVKKFQQSAGLTGDGICGPATLAALRTALRGT